MYNFQLKLFGSGAGAKEIFSAPQPADIRYMSNSAQTKKQIRTDQKMACVRNTDKGQRKLVQARHQIRTDPKKAVLWIRIGFNADPDPAFYLDPDLAFYFNSDPDPVS